MAAWAGYAIAQVPQGFTPITGVITRHDITGLIKLAGESEDLSLIPKTGEVEIC